MRLYGSRALVLLLAVSCVASLRCRAAAQADRVAAAEKAKQAWSQETRTALGFEDGSLWRGGAAVSSPRKAGEGALRWERHTKSPSVECLRVPGDLSAFNTISFWLHSARANNATFMIVIESRRDKEEFAYFSNKVTVDWTGWKRVELRFRSFGAARSPVGWHKIDRILFTASGWNQEVSDESVWVLDELDFSYDPSPYRPVVNVKRYVKEPSPREFLARLRPGHPRLILLDDELPRIKRFVTDDPLGVKWYGNVKRRAQGLRTRPVRERVLPDGRRLLSVSRDVCDRLYHWCFLYRVEGDRAWLDRAWREMEAVIGFTDWNPSHYLDTAEMMHAVGIGYDWLYNDLTEAQRTTIREGLWRLGLSRSYAAYTQSEGRQWWVSAANNWNFVCNGGTSLAAMAVLEEMPERCSEILHLAFQYIQIPLHHFEPDGAWWEGVGYWGYSMRYFLPYLRGLETAFGTDFGFVESLEGTGFSHAGDFPIYLASPQGSFFNFADSGSGRGSYEHWGFFFLADRFRNPLYLHFQRERTRGGVSDILYYRPFESALAAHEMPLDRHFRQTEVATMRSSWTDPNALFAGIKCGRNGVAHAHQDLGSFILYGLGEKWVIDLGTERQTYLSHQHHLPRWHFYRIREEGHNTLVFDPNERFSQDERGSSQIVRFESSPKEAFAVADLTGAYRRQGTSVMRGYRLLDHRRAFLVQDEIRGGEPGDLWWFAHADAGTVVTLSESRREAVLARSGTKCLACLLAPAGAAFAVMDAAPLPSSPSPEIQNPNRGIGKLAVHLPEAKDVTVAVLFAPAFEFEPAPAEAPDVVPLDSWRLAPGAGPGLSGITVDGAALPGFSAGVYSYTVQLPPDTRLVPSFAAQAERAAHQVGVEAPGSFPGTARITVTDGPGGAASVYLVRLVPKAPPREPGARQRRSNAVTHRGVTVSASHDDGNEPKNVLDGDSATRWSASGEKEWIAFDFGEPRTLQRLSIAWYSGETRRTRFKVSVSADGRTWRDVFEGQSSGKTSTSESYSLGESRAARHLRITCYGNTLNLWNSITEVGF